MKNQIKSILKSGMIMVTFMTVTLTVLADDHEENTKKQRKGPPPQAIEACANLNEGDACQFSGRRGDVSGTCFLPPKDGAELACKPSGHKERKRD